MYFCCEIDCALNSHYVAHVIILDIIGDAPVNIIASRATCVIITNTDAVIKYITDYGGDISAEFDGRAFYRSFIVKVCVRLGYSPCSDLA